MDYRKLTTILTEKSLGPFRAGTKPVYKIASIWALVMKDKKGKPDWDTIIALLRWFYNRLDGATYQKLIALPKRNARKKLENEFNKIMSNNEKKRELEMLRDFYFPPKS
jgi:hypothetical protein